MMIIVITNRKLPEIPTNQPLSIKVADLGSSLGDRNNDEDIIYSGVLSNNENVIDFYPGGQEPVLFSKITDHEREKPWVIFVHGFNQEPLDNIDKARALSAYHGVNVIAFAWPSKPLDKSMHWEDAFKTIAKDALADLSGSKMLINLIKRSVTSFLKDKWDNYEPAIKNAEQSNVDLIAAINLISGHLKASKPPVLLVHSMGNYLLENTMANIDSLPMKFSNIVLHQGDADSSDYAWVSKLLDNLDTSLENPARAYLTINYADFVLGASTSRRFILNAKENANLSTERIGQIRSNHRDCGFAYLDFSDGQWVDNEHEFFQLPKDKTNDAVYECLHRILRGKPDELPTNERDSESGFTRIPAGNASIHLYRLEEIIHPADDDFEGYTSLQEYDDNHRPHIDNDPDMFGDD